MQQKPNEKQIRREILEKVKVLHNFRESQNQFVPGEDPIRYAGRVFDDKELVNLVDSSLDFWLTAGRFAETFEKDFAKFIGTRYCMLTNSGSSANLLALSALTSEKLGERRLSPGDEVITVAASFPTTVSPIYQNNLVPVYCDIELGTNNIDIKDLEAGISDRTKAIMLAHSLGNPFNIDKIIELKEKHNLWFIEDNCDAVGSSWNDKMTGTFGDISTVSFYPAHHITMGEGGAVMTKSPLLKKIIRSFRDWGKDCWCDPGVDNTCGKRFAWQLGELPFGYDHKFIFSHIGYNLKITDMQAAVGVAQLDKLPDFIKKRKENFKFFFEYFKQYEDYFLLPQWESQASPSWFGFFLTVRNYSPFTKNQIVNFLENSKIATRMLFGGNLIRQPAFIGRPYRIIGDLRDTDYVVDNGFWIGVYPGLTEPMKQYVVDKFEEFFKLQGLPSRND